MNNMYFDEYPFMNEEITSINKMNTSNNNMFGSYEGYLKGNMYKDLYKPYKDYKTAKLIPNNEQAELLLNINQLEFASHDIRLYLDNYPTDSNMIKMYNDYQEQANQAIDNYEQKYGPICMNTLSSNDMFSWEKYIWPWEMGEE